MNRSAFVQCAPVVVLAGPPACGSASSLPDSGSQDTPGGGSGGAPDAGTGPAAPRLLGVIGTDFDPAFLSLENFPAASTSLVVTTFSASPLGGTAGVSYVAGIGQRLQSLSTAKDTPLASAGITWPNEAAVPPPGVFSGNGLVVAGGFLVPSNSTGAINFVSSAGQATKLTTDKQDWFYHRVAWVDMNGDSKLDMLTARATKPLLGGGPAGELLWLQAPASGPASGVWTEHSLTSGASAPDVLFRTADLDSDGSPEILAAQFFSAKLVRYWLETSTLRSRVIDGQIGSAFDLQLVDFNGDGWVELFVPAYGKKKVHVATFAP